VTVEEQVIWQFQVPRVLSRDETMAKVTLNVQGE
jgi:hypothetical protein